MDLERVFAMLASSYVAYGLFWAILIAVAALEVFSPGRVDRKALGPRMEVNFAFGLTTMALLSLPLISEFALAQLAQARGWGLLNVLKLGPIWAIALSLLACDLCGYLFHRASHRLPWLWRLHRVHHSDSDMDLTTYFRSHPLEVMIALAIKYALIVALGLHPLALLLYGVTKQVTMTLGHANIVPRPRLSRLASTLFVSPAFHQIHHSAHRLETDSNYGEVMTIWDRLLGTMGRVEGPVARFGLGDAYDAEAASLKSQMKLPFLTHQRNR